MQFCRKKSYLINKTMVLSKHQLLIMLENFPNFDLEALLIKEIINIDDNDEAALTHLIDVVDSIIKSTDKQTDISDYQTEQYAPPIMKYQTSQFAIDDQSIMLNNRRTATRKAVCMDVQLVRNDKSSLEECIDISASGMFVRTDEQFSPDEDITVSMMISHNDIQEEITLESKVVRIPGNGVGIQFNSKDCKNRARLEELLKKL
ncbi:MAG: PilZ domain-containing protein [Desulfamplus sp.]|nr:PilZ domain-containing protein [Desulfamplus sp.]